MEFNYASYSCVNEDVIEVLQLKGKLFWGFFHLVHNVLYVFFLLFLFVQVPFTDKGESENNKFFCQMFLLRQEMIMKLQPFGLVIFLRDLFIQQSNCSCLVNAHILGDPCCHICLSSPHLKVTLSNYQTVF